MSVNGLPIISQYSFIPFVKLKEMRPLTRNLGHLRMLEEDDIAGAPEIYDKVAIFTG